MNRVLQHARLSRCMHCLDLAMICCKHSDRSQRKMRIYKPWLLWKNGTRIWALNCIVMNEMPLWSVRFVTSLTLGVTCQTLQVTGEQSEVLQCESDSITEEERLKLPITREVWYPLLRYEALA